MLLPPFLRFMSITSSAAGIAVLLVITRSSSSCCSLPPCSKSQPQIYKII